MDEPMGAPLPPAGAKLSKAPPRMEMSVMGLVGVLTLVAAGFYFMFTYTGPFQWLAELQLRLMDGYSEELTFILTICLVFIPAALVWKCVQVAVRKMGPGGGAGTIA